MIQYYTAPRLSEVKQSFTFSIRFRQEVDCVTRRLWHIKSLFWLVIFSCGFVGGAAANGHPSKYELLTAPLPIALPSAASVTCTNGLGGMVFNDFNNDGVKTGTALSGIPGVTVTAYDCLGNLLGTTTTDASGVYSFTATAFTLTATYPIRVEFSNLPAWAVPTANGTDGRTDVQFVAAPDCNVDYGAVSPGEYCQASPRLAVSCFVNGVANNTTAPVDVLVSMNYLASSASPAGLVDEADKNLAGSVWGVAYNRTTKKIYSASFLKRHVGLKGGLGDIYVSTAGSPADASLFVTVPNAGTIATDATRGLGAPSAQSTDVDAFGKVGRVGLGGLAISEDNKTLYTVNLNDKKLYVIDVATQAMSGISIPTICDVSKGQQVPFAVKVWHGNVYVGVVCDASISKSRADLKSHVLVFNPVTEAFSATPVLSVNLDYTKGIAWNNTTYSFAGQTAAALSNKWYPWEDAYNTTNLMVFKNGSDTRDLISHPTPILSDIEFDAQGNMILGFMDRIGHQFGESNRTPTNSTNEAAITGGDMLKATFVSPTTWTIESNIATGGEFFKGENYLTDHLETSDGGIYYSAQDNLVALTAMDPINYTSGGVIYLSNTTGAQTQTGAQLFIGGLPNFGKATGLGDITAFCDPLPFQIGNRVFRDDNQNGIQDACEPALAGVTVTLYNGAKTTAIASATTNSSGEYYFSSATTTALLPNTTYALVITNMGSTGLSITAVSPLTPGENTTVNSGTSVANNDAILDTGKPCIKFTTGGPGETNHTYDFGLVPPPCVKPTLAAIPSQSLCQGSGSFTFPLVSNVISNTTTGLQWYVTNATGTAFTAISGATSLSLSSAQAVPPTTGTQTKYYALIGQNGPINTCSDTVFTSLYMKATQTIAFTAPSATTVTQCAATPLILTVNANATAPDAIRFVYFTSPQSGTAMYTGGTDFGMVASTTVVATKPVSLTTAVPPNTTTGTLTYYVYALLESADKACKPFDSFVLHVTPKPIAVIGGATTVCQGTSTALTLPPGLSYKWSTGALTRQISPLISATATSSVYSATLTSVDGCASDPATFTVTGVACTSCVAGAGRVGGTVYNDFDANGIQLSSEPGLSGITVNIYACDATGNSTLAGTTTTDFIGNYLFSGLTDGVTYRVEFSNVPAQFEQSARGANSGTSVQFVKSPSCGVSLGLSDPANYCAADAPVAVVCFARNTDGVAEPTIITVSYADGTDFTARAAADATKDWATPTGTLPLAAKMAIATVGDVATTFGLAWDKTHKQAFTGAYARAFAPMKTATNGFGEGVIYKIGYASGSATTPGVWLDLETVLGAGVSGTFVTDATFPAADVGGLIGNNSAKIGYTGLGSMRMATDDSELYVVNLNKLEVLVIPVDAAGAPLAAQLKRFPLPTDGCPTGSWSDGRPYRAALGLGVHPTTKRVYATLTCTGPTLADLKGLVYSFDPSDASPAATDFRLETTVSLNTSIPATNPNVNPWYEQTVHPWDVFNTPGSAPYTNTSADGQHTQPWLGEVEFDQQPNGQYGMLLSTRNRYHDLINESWYVTGGTLQRVANTGTDVSPTWALESNAVAGDQVSTVNWTLNGATNAGGNTSLTNRFFKYVGREGTMLSGTMDYIPGRPEIILPAMDNVYHAGNSGITWLNRTTGERSQDIHLLGDNAYSSAGYYTLNFPKANNWGGLVVLCTDAPIQIGNRVWRDDNQNGIQDPCEPPIPGAVVKLYDAAKTTVLASVTTNAAGEYYFSSTTITTGNSTSSVATTALTYNTSYGLVITSLGTSSVVAGLSLTNVSPLTPGESGAINSGTSLANNDAKIDVVGGISSPCIKLTTGGPGDINHTYDFGIAVPPCVKLDLADVPSQTLCQGATFTFPLTSSVVSSTYTSLQWYLTNAAGTSYTAISGATSLSLSSAQAVAPTAGQTKYYALIGLNGLSSLCADTAFVDLTLKPTPTITAFTAPASATTTVCANTTMNLAVTTNIVGPDQIKFLYFSDPLTSDADAYTATGGQLLGSVISTTAVGNKTLTLVNAQLPDNTGNDDMPIYVYAIVQSDGLLCGKPVLVRTIVLKPRPQIFIGGDPLICQGTSATLTASGAPGTTYRWYANGTIVAGAAGTVNPYITPAINASAIYSVVATLNSCVSDEAAVQLTPVVCTPCVGGTGTVGGVVFRDFNSTGVKDATDPGMGTITVTIFRCDANGGSVQVAQMQTDIKGQYSFTGLTGGTDYRVEFSGFPAGYEPTYRGTNNGSSVQFTKPGSCTTSLGLNQPADYCQNNPQLVTPCYLDGAVTPNTTALNDVLVSINYDYTGKTVEATRTEIGSTWGLGYAKTTRKLYSGAFLKRHVGLKDGKLGQIYVTDFATAGTPTTPWLDVSTLGLGGNWQFLTDAQRGLGNAGTPTADPSSFSVVATVGLGDIDVSEDETQLYAMDLLNKQLLVIDIASKTLVGAYPVPNVCVGTATPSYYSAYPQTFTSADGKLWKNGYYFNTDNGGTGYTQAITNPNSATAGTTDATLYTRSIYSGTVLNYQFPLGNGTYSVKFHTITNGITNASNFNILAEGTTVFSNVNVYAEAGNAINKGIVKTFTATVTDGVLDIRLVNNAAGTAIIASGFEITPTSGQASGQTRPFAIKPYKGKVYVGAICDASGSQDMKDLNAGIFVFDPQTSTFTATPVLTIPLDYQKGPSVILGTISPLRWFPWTNVYPNNTASGIGTSGGFDVYNQPVLSDLEFDLDGSLIIGFFDRMGHQMGANLNLKPNGQATGYGVVGGELLRAYFNGTGYELEDNGKEGASSTKPATAGAFNGQGIGGGEFYFGDHLGGNAAGAGTATGHYETSMGGLAFLPGSGEVRATVGDPLVFSSGGLGSFNNTTGNKQNLVTLYSGTANGVQLKSNGLGDLEILCDVAPIQIGNRVWRDDNRNGVQDPCEPPIPGAVVKLYDAAKTTVLASVTTNAAGEYYFSSATVVAGTSTSSVATTALTYNTTYGLVITSLGTSTVVAGLSLTDVSPLTPGESSSINSGTSLSNNDAKVDADKPCIKLTTGGPGEINHTYDFGIVKFICSLTVTAQASSQTVCSGLPVTLTAQVSPASSYTYAWSAPAGVTLTGGNTATATASASVAGLQTFTVTVTSSPACFSTAVVSVSVVVCQVPPASLGDYVFIDKNKDGIQNAGDTPIPGVLVTLYQNGSVVATTTTDANGSYSFTGLTPGTSNSYVVGFTAPTGYTATAPFSGTDIALDSDANPITGLTQSVTLAPGENNPTLDAGFYLLPASLGDYVWLDTNKNGLQDPTETGVASVTAVLCDATSGTVISTTVTDGAGKYLFTNLAPGSYLVKFTAPANMTFTTPNSGTDATDSDVASLTANTGSTGVYSLTAGEQNLTVDAGLIPLTAGLGDYVFEDKNANGIQDTGDVPIPGVRVTLYTNGSVINTTLTDANGLYSFTGLTPGTLYVVGFGQPAGYVPTAANVGSNDAIDSDASVAAGLTGTYSLTANEFNPTVDAGFYKPASLGDYVFNDKNRDGVQDAGDSPIPDVVVTLYQNGSAVATTTTDVNGLYSFTGLTPGTSNSYVVGFTAPAGYLATSPLSGTDNAKDSNADPITGRTSAVTLASGENNPTIDAGFFQPTAGLGDYVFEDVNANGQQDTGDKPIAGVTVSLLSSGTLVATTTTDASGLYSFTGLTPGVVYSVSFTAPAGFTATTQNTGADVTDSDGNPATGLTGTYSLTANEFNPTVDMGYYKPASLGDKVFADNNKNGVLDAADSPLTGVTVTLISNGTVVATTTTVTSGTGIGCYSFTGLTPGVPYSVSFSTPVGYTATTPLSGTDTTIDSNPVGGITTPVTLTSGENNPTIDAGFVRLTASLGDYVWLDTNKNGQQDPTETGVGSVTAVLCDAASGTVVSTTVTDGAGKYLFTNLNPGSYLVKFTAPAGTTFTSANVDPDATDSDVASLTGNTGSTGVYSLSAGEQNLTVDAGLTPMLGSLGDLVWKEVVRNGQYDTGVEAGVPGVTIRLLEVTSPVGSTAVSTSLVSTTVTDAGGHYLFPNLPAGRYIVAFDATTFPPDCQLSPDYKVPGAGDTLDSDADPSTGRSPIIEIVPGDPLKTTVLTVKAAVISTTCVSVCVPIVVKRVR